MSDYSNLQKITKEAIIKKYNITEKYYNNLRKRLSERIINARQLYLWYGDEDVPSITQLIDYSLKKRKFDIQKYEIILGTSTTKKLSMEARRKALNIYSGESGTFNSGFYTFSTGIKQFEIMYENARKKLSKTEYNEPMEKLPFFKVGVKFSSVHGYYFKNNHYGNDAVNRLNNIITQYNSFVDKTSKNTALQFYITYVRLMMEVINFADEHDAMAGSL